MPKKTKCEGWHSLSSEIAEATNKKDLEKRVSDWPSGPYVGRGDKKTDAEKSAKAKAKEAADDWCKARNACGAKLTCKVDDFDSTFNVVEYSDTLEEWVAILSIDKVECKYA